MKKSIKITVANPCHENWHTMTPTEQGKFCNACTKEVIDFTSLNDEQIYKRVAEGNNLCGRFLNSQLDREIMLSRKRTSTPLSYAAALLLPAALFSTQDVQSQETSTSLTYENLTLPSLDRETSKTLFSPFAVRIKGFITYNNQPLTGCSVSIKNSDRNCITDAFGFFKLQALPGEFLIIEKEGYLVKEIALDENQWKYAISLDRDTTAITRKITGTIAENGGPLPGANILIKNTDKGTTSDFDGAFQLDVQEGDTLLISFIGYKTQEVKIENQIALNIHLEPDMILGEFVTVGMVVRSHPTKEERKAQRAERKAERKAKKQARRLKQQKE